MGRGFDPLCCQTPEVRNPQSLVRAAAGNGPGDWLHVLDFRGRRQYPLFEYKGLRVQSADRSPDRHYHEGRFSSYSLEWRDIGCPV